jgi:hypothetical protein
VRQRRSTASRNVHQALQEDAALASAGSLTNAPAALRDI